MPSSTYDHRLMRTGHPVRSAILKHQIGRSVVEWVTISEPLLLYVFDPFLLNFSSRLLLLSCVFHDKKALEGIRLAPAFVYKRSLLPSPLFRVNLYRHPHPVPFYLVLPQQLCIDPSSATSCLTTRKEKYGERGVESVEWSDNITWPRESCEWSIDILKKRPLWTFPSLFIARSVPQKWPSLRTMKD